MTLNVRISIKSLPEGLAGQVIYLTIVTMHQVINPKNTEYENNKSLYSMTLTKDMLRYGRNT